MRFIKLLLFVIFYVISPLSMAQNQLEYFEPKVVELNGAIRTLTFPGPPNYESIKNGDASEIGPYLILDNPIDIKRISKLQNDINEPEKNVKILQLVVLNDNDWGKVKAGNYVHITGVLFHGIAGHHHTRVLFKINKIEVISKQKTISKKLDITDEDRQFMK